jgi:hypothetical protein
VAQCGENRGYEMWLLSEGYKRNPDLQSYLLSWGVPRWVGNGSYFSAENIAYQVGYAKCVQQTIGGSNPHFIGIWNERSWGSVEYVVSLRDALDNAEVAALVAILGLDFSKTYDGLDAAAHRVAHRQLQSGLQLVAVAHPLHV